MNNWVDIDFGIPLELNQLLTNLKNIQDFELFLSEIWQIASVNFIHQSNSFICFFSLTTVIECDKFSCHVYKCCQIWFLKTCLCLILKIGPFSIDVEISMKIMKKSTFLLKCVKKSLELKMFRGQSSCITKQLGKTEFAKMLDSVVWFVFNSSSKRKIAKSWVFQKCWNFHDF